MIFVIKLAVKTPEGENSAVDIAEALRKSLTETLPPRTQVIFMKVDPIKQ